MMRGAVNGLWVLGVILLILGLWKRNDLPEPGPLYPGITVEPLQTANDKPPFPVEAGGIRYEVLPRYRYELRGMVVSTHDARSWRDYIHKDWNDRLNVMDLCVIWGRNLEQGLYQDIRFRNGEFTCTWMTRSEATYRAFDQTTMSNNHILTADPALADRIAEARPGDQIVFRGWLAEYSHHHGFNFHRGTSTVRTDTGNGACETVYVEDFAILRRGRAWWDHFIAFGGLVLAMALAGWIALPVRIR